MSKRVQAQAAQDEQEESPVRKLARSHHGPADWRVPYLDSDRSLIGKTPNEIATELGHRIKEPRDYSRGPEKTWVYATLRVRDGKELTRCSALRNSTNSIAVSYKNYRYAYP